MLEVILSLAIFMGALAVITQGLETGRQASRRSQLQTEAVLHCQSKLSEVIAGLIPLQPIQDAPVDQFSPGWTWSMFVEPGPHEDLLLIEVSVAHTGAGGMTEATFAIQRLIRDPQLFFDAAQQLELEESVW